MLTPDQNDRLRTILENLDERTSKLDERSRDFVSQTIQRYDQYEDRIKLSEKQWSWLESLHKKFCADAPPLPEVEAAAPSFGYDDGDPGPEPRW